MNWRLNRGPLWYFIGLPPAYVLTGHIGLKLAVDPGYATLIFLPAGLACASSYYSWWALPGIFGGSLLLNLWQGESWDPLVVSTATAIASASVIQAAVAGPVFRVALSRPPVYSDIPIAAGFAPALCLISSTLSLAVMYMLGEQYDPVRNWLAWWTGDSLGVIVCITAVILWQRKFL